MKGSKSNFNLPVYSRDDISLTFVFILSIVGGKLFAGNRGFDPKTITLEIISM